MPTDDAMAAPVAHEQMIAVTAFYLAEQRGFSPGRQMEDWLQAEKGIDSGASGTTAEI